MFIFVEQIVLIITEVFRLRRWTLKGISWDDRHLDTSPSCAAVQVLEAEMESLKSNKVIIKQENWPVWVAMLNIDGGSWFCRWSISSFILKRENRFRLITEFGKLKDGYLAGPGLDVIMIEGFSPGNLENAGTKLQQNLFSVYHVPEYAWNNIFRFYRNPRWGSWWKLRFPDPTHHNFWTPSVESKSPRKRGMKRVTIMNIGCLILHTG